MAVVFIESLVLNRGNAKEPASLSGDSVVAQTRRARNASDARATGDEAQGNEAANKHYVGYTLLQNKDLILNVSIKVQGKCYHGHLSCFFRLPELFEALFWEMINFIPALRIIVMCSSAFLLWSV